VAVEAQPVHGAAGAERQRVARLVDDAGEGVGAGDPGQAVLGTMAAVHQVGEVALRGRRDGNDKVRCSVRYLTLITVKREITYALKLHEKYSIRGNCHGCNTDYYHWVAALHQHMLMGKAVF